MSIYYFPKFFLCYFAMYHLYFFSYPFGFAYLSLCVAACHVLYWMLHFYHTYEIPLVVQGRLSSAVPRQIPIAGTSISPAQSPNPAQPTSSPPVPPVPPVPVPVVPVVPRRPRAYSTSSSSPEVRGNIYETVDARRARLGSSPAASAPPRPPEAAVLPPLHLPPVGSIEDEEGSDLGFLMQRRPGYGIAAASNRQQGSGARDKYGYDRSRFSVFGNDPNDDSHSPY